jgi:threonylcarbamoyladenosine tRNA methylthiotransferase MtaB
MKVFLKALGCRLNEAELSAWAEEYIQQGHDITQDENDANLIVFNSCSVTQQADKKSRQLLKRYNRNNPNAKIIATGCSSTLNHQTISAINGVSLVVDNKQKDDLVALSSKLQTIPITVTPLVKEKTTAQHQLFSRGRERAFIKVQDGCRYRCTFCIVTVARGEEKSKPIRKIIEEITLLQTQGIKEVVLTGVHLGGYGSDIESNLDQLIQAILDKTSVERIRLGSLEPWELPPLFFGFFKNPRIMPHLHLPLQSGSDAILRKMARRCKTDEFLELITLAKNAHPDMNITTDIIVGFPGETEALWQESLKFIKQCSFSHIHIFSYSKREGTKAANLPNQVETPDKKQRHQILQALTKTTNQHYLNSQIGKTAHILWESKTEAISDKISRQWGYTSNYLRVVRDLPQKQALCNEITHQEIKSFETEINCIKV